MSVVRRGILHKLFAEWEAKVMLVKPKGVVNTGREGGEKTAESDVWLWNVSQPTRYNKPAYCLQVQIGEMEIVSETLQIRRVTLEDAADLQENCFSRSSLEAVQTALEAELAAMAKGSEFVSSLP